MLERVFLSAGSEAGGPYWIGLLGIESVSIKYAKGITTDQSGNIYICGASLDGYNFQIAKYNTAGTLQWQRRLYSGDLATANSITTDSSGNVYVTGYTATNTIQFVKYDSSGNLQLQRALFGTNAKGYGITTTNSGYIAVTGRATISVVAMIVALYNSAGTLQWQKRIYGISSARPAIGYSIVSNGTWLYACGQYFDGSRNNIHLVKLDETGSGFGSWQRDLQDTDNLEGYAVTCDADGNIYICTSSTQNYVIIAKYNSAGTLQWQRRIFTDGVPGSYSIASDSSNNVYIIGHFNSGTDRDIFIFKYNSDGSIQWQRSLNSGGEDYGYSIDITPTGEIVISGQSMIGGFYGMLVAKLPSDGSKTGTYSVGGYSFTYAVLSKTESAGTLLENNQTLSIFNPNLSEGATGRTESATTLTSTVTTI